jgi:hypothetical protein
MSRIAAFALLALLTACKERQAQIRFTFPGSADGGVDGGAGGCSGQGSLRCVNYLQFSTGNGGFSSGCAPVDVALENLCDLARLAEGQELFKLPPETLLPIRVAGVRAFPADSCIAGTCSSRTIFSGATAESGVPIADYAGRILEIPLTLNMPCGIPEEFYLLPEGSTCTQVCHSPELLVCDNVAGGCLCKHLPTADEVASRQGGIDSGQGAPGDGGAD